MATTLNKNKEQVLIKCKRHCALCERCVGVKIEVHHIVPKQKGGSDDIENLIPLCFDCHQEVGGYNTNHPKGNKYTENELKARRDEVYRLVEEGKLPVRQDKVSVHMKEKQRDYERRLAVEKDFRAICTLICNDDLRKPTLGFFEKCDELELKYYSDSFFSDSTLLTILQELASILSIKTSPARPIIDRHDQDIKRINKLRSDFAKEYRRLFYITDDMN